MLSLVFAAVAFQLNISMINPALVSISREFHVDEVVIGVSQTAFFMVAALFSIFLPSVSDILGRKKVLLIILFTMFLGNILTVVSYDNRIFYFARFLQGTCGPVISISLLMIYHEIRDRRTYGLWMGIVAAVNTGVAGIDSLVGGYLTTHFGFRAIFIVVALFSFLAWMAVFFFSKESKPLVGKKIDIPGIFLIVLVFFFLLLSLNELGKIHHIRWAYIGFLLILSLGCFVCFYLIEKRSRTPVIQISYLFDRQVWSLLSTTVFTMVGVFAIVNFLMTSYAQNQSIGFGLDAAVTSILLLTPFSIIGWIIAPIVGRMAAQVGYTVFLRFSLLATFLSILFLYFCGLNHIELLVLSAVFLGITYAGAVNTILNILGIILSPKESPGFLSGMNAGVFNLGAGLSFSILPGVQTILFSHYSDLKASYSYSILLGGGFIVLALMISLFIPVDRKKA